MWSTESTSGLSGLRRPSRSLVSRHSRVHYRRRRRRRRPRSIDFWPNCSQYITRYFFAISPTCMHFAVAKFGHKASTAWSLRLCMVYDVISIFTVRCQMTAVSFLVEILNKLFHAVFYTQRKPVNIRRWVMVCTAPYNMYGKARASRSVKQLLCWPVTSTVRRSTTVAIFFSPRPHTGRRPFGFILHTCRTASVQIPKWKVLF